MATKYNLTTAFTAITETSGTIQNVGKEAVELASSTNAVEGEGIVLNPSEKRSFKGALSARSMGDAGAVVNVVDFTEAGEGGEEYDLPIASNTKLGGIKIGNSFTVTDDGTLNIKKSGKTILGGVKSSDDEGKVTVNNDGTMTYNPLGYRQPSTIYAAGNITYHSALPTGYYLECTTAGITLAGDITPSSTIGGTVADGTVVWKVCKDIGTGNAPIYAGFNQKQTFTSSDSFTAPVTGTYKITLQGGGGGGAGAGGNLYGIRGGGGGGQGGHLEFYEALTAGTTYSFTIGAGGTGGTAGSATANSENGQSGGNSSITINSNAYIANGGGGGYGTADGYGGGNGATATINGTVASKAIPGNAGSVDALSSSSHIAVGGAGGGMGGGRGNLTGGGTALYGGGGSGGGKNISTFSDGNSGGDGYITFEWQTASLV